MRSEYDGVKFYAKDDRSVGVELQKAEPILASFDASKDYNDVNELLELCACSARACTPRRSLLSPTPMTDWRSVYEYHVQVYDV